MKITTNITPKMKRRLLLTKPFVEKIQMKTKVTSLPKTHRVKIVVGEEPVSVPLTEKEKKWLKAMDEDVPTCYSPSVSSWEQSHGRGLWGNPSSGYIYDKNNK